MTEFKDYAPGTFCWVDLATTDAEASKKFYTQLFGWTATDVPAGEAGTYTMLEKAGKNVCALYQMDEVMQQQSPSPYWLSYVSVQNVDDSTEKAKTLGGQILQTPCDVMDSGRMSLIQDPTGAVFALWQPGQHIGADLANEPATFCWNELHTKDVEKATQFYSQLFGWGTKKSQNATGGDYIEFLRGDHSGAGMMEIQPDWGEVPPNWAIYFTVEDCDATLEKAEALGGHIEMQPMEMKDVGKFAIIKDPQGAYFTVIQMPEGVS
ncbi:VOC family protein [Oscillatoria sp. CS-180]|uniref:VOC family protein n=1 Tax=Oscillatoria sp. CS-180 TaxID=3021720 RepID=UPI00232CD71E|nr:VOC family protein [Oscillatoria sp. CS-180]MDB9525603.1 VOC family protein [Oscillatoria sp. CS-180]